MAPPTAGAKKNNRRRKKRRTEDFSSDSDSSSSDSEQEQLTQNHIEEAEDELPKENINIEEIDIESDTEQGLNGKLVPEKLSLEQTKDLQHIKLTSTPLSNLTTNPKTIANAEQIQQALTKDRKELNNEYLKLMAGEFGNDLDELRKKPDFTDKSLVTLAKALQSGSNMFDVDTLNSILK